MKKLAVVLSLIALVPFALAACGGDDDGDGEETQPVETTEEPAEEPADGGAATTVEVAADPNGALAYEEDSLQAEAGEVTFELTNESATPHDFVIETGDGSEVTSTDVITEDTASTTAMLEAGDYTFYCSVDAHREAGMEGPLTVE